MKETAKPISKRDTPLICGIAAELLLCLAPSLREPLRGFISAAGHQAKSVASTLSLDMEAQSLAEKLLGLPGKADPSALEAAAYARSIIRYVAATRASQTMNP